MIKIGSFDAKTHFSEIVQNVSRGKEYLVTKNGKPVARILPPESPHESLQQTISEILHCRVGRKANAKIIRELIEEGRKG